RSQAHPHDNRLLIDTMVCGIPGRNSAGVGLSSRARIQCRMEIAECRIKDKQFLYSAFCILHSALGCAPPSLRAGGFAPAVRQRRNVFSVVLSARQTAWNNAAEQITALTPPSPLPFATAVTAVPGSTDARPRIRYPLSAYPPKPTEDSGRQWQIADSGKK